MDEVLVGTLVASTLRVSVPLILCALAGVLCERAGVIDLGLEGKMLSTAFAAAAVGAVTQSLPLALAVALAVGIALSLLHGYACVSHRGDQVVLGMAITMTAAGLTVVLGIAWFQLGGQTPPLPDAVRLDRWFVGAGEVVAGWPLVGRALSIAFFGHTALVYLSLVAVAAVWWLLYRTRFGLRLRAAGENPAMVDAAGVSVLRLRYAALMLNGGLCALAGASLVLVQNPSFIPNMTAGRGYMALAAMIFGKWHPVGALGACLLFGFLDAVSIRLQGVALPPGLGGGEVPVQAIQALPYVLTVVLLAGFIGRSRAPAALGRPYLKER
ncbi:ABC transporter permease [Piscinibacter sakaiensis]|uniref:Putative nucleoside ABC transporter, permease 2 component n=1 Tax=Piscinibacter sakaiensis TaxID=1547922 RepID=A0A0K8P7L7_PISS1|nr:ABC transporter permease [Piscinibacter sakaiensis]GAP38631.1 putative nucleoside ABC transporter, permease 2 component [Piscinibacter sakaiensis]